MADPCSGVLCRVVLFVVIFGSLSRRFLLVDAFIIASVDAVYWCRRHRCSKPVTAIWANIATSLYRLLRHLPLPTQKAAA